MIFNTKGEIIRLTITPGNVGDRTPILDMMKNITADVFMGSFLFEQEDDR